MKKSRLSSEKNLSAKEVTALPPQRERAEEDLSISQQMLPLVLDTIPQRVFWKDRNLTYLGCNRPFANDAGYEHPCQIVGKNDTQLYPKNIADLYNNDDRKVIETGVTKLDYEEPLIKPDGTRLWLKTSKVPLRDRDGNIIGVLGSYEDITKKREVEEALRQARDSLELRVQERTATLRAGEERFRALLENSADRIGMLDASGTIIYGSPSTPRIYGYEVEDLVGTHAFSYVQPEDLQVTTEIFTKLLEQPGSKKRVKYRARHKAGHYVWMEAFVWSALDNPAVQAIVLNERDITERKRAEEEIQALNQQLKERAKKLHAANVRLRDEIRERQRLEGEIIKISEAEQRRLGQDLHDDLGQQLTGMSLLAKSLASDLLSEAHVTGRAANELVNLLQNSVRTTRTLAKGFYPIELEQGGLILALRELAQSMKILSGVRCEVRHDPSFHFESNHSLHLYRIAQEALTNAIKHAKPTKIVIECNSFDGKPRLTITDDGVGLQKRSNKTKGMGLHLFNYRARLIGAKIEVANAKSGGCQVTCTLKRNSSTSEGAIEPPMGGTLR